MEKEIKLNYTKEYAIKVIINLLIATISCGITIYLCEVIKNSDKIHVSQSNFDSIQVGCVITVIVFVIYSMILLKRCILKQPYLVISHEGIMFKDRTFKKNNFSWCDIEYINFYPFIIKHKKQRMKQASAPIEYFDRDRVKNQILQNFRYEIRSNNIKIQSHDFNFEKNNCENNKIEIFYTSGYIKLIIFIDIIVIPFCIFLILFGSLSSSKGYQKGNIGGFGVLLIIFAMSLFTFTVLKAYFHKEPCILINENGIFVGDNLFSWNFIKSISFTDKIVIDLENNVKSINIHTLNLEIDPPYLRNQIVSKFRDEIEFFNVEINSK